MKEKKSRIEYHLVELEIAKNQDSPFHIMPSFSEEDHAVLDIGCGIGQTFAVSGFKVGRCLVGLDVDMESLAYGRRQFGFINFTNAAAESLPFKDDSFDFVISRVSLPYTNIPRSLVEIRRVLKDDGRVWFTLHSFSKALRNLKISIAKPSLKQTVFASYVIINGLFFHFFGKQFAFPATRTIESFQTEVGIIKALKNAGFANPKAQRKVFFVVTAQKTG